ncbi:nitrosoguanidine resistance [Fusarium albosuccineum]|uniref:Nitrosoguanidine resistance n=1 Tax=Fusarium albosuccineum TaxID=1237068 RepID=A0A8H4LK85_9HYPO|nr:nitrosoguanidine resistance [Fusarium albosuccineum]
MSIPSPGQSSLWDPCWNGRRKGLFIASIMSALLLQLLILGNMSYLYGTSFHQSARSHALNILVLDFDKSDIGAAMLQASTNLQGDYFPTIDTSSTLSDPEAVRQSVCNEDYWAAMFVNQGASEHLHRTLDGTSDQDYDPTSAITYIYNQARYPIVADSVLINSISSIVQASRDAYYESANGTAALASLNASNPVARAAYLNPIGSTAHLIQPTRQVSRAFHNTVNFVIPPLAQFFFILALNGIGLQMGFLTGATVKDVWLFRFIAGKVYALVSGLVMAGYIWSFKEDSVLGSSAFFKSWMLFWFLMDVHWQVMETVIASYVPIQYTPFFVFTWIITNVASTVFPYELTPGWYRIGYALPSREAYVIMIQIWSGCASELHIALPVLFTWWLVGHITAAFSVRKRCFDAAKSAAEYDAGELTAASSMTRVTQEEDKTVT